MIKYIACFFMVTLLSGFFCVSNIIAQEEKKTLTEEEAKIAQQKLKEALKSLKKEIRTEVKVENPGSITGTVKCSLYYLKNWILLRDFSFSQNKGDIDDKKHCLFFYGNITFWFFLCF